MNERDEADNDLFGIIYGVTDNPDWAVSEVHDAILAAGYRKPREAKAEALEEAANAAESMHEPAAPDCKEWADWLRARATAARTQS